MGRRRWQDGVVALLGIGIVLTPGAVSLVTPELRLSQEELLYFHLVGAAVAAGASLAFLRRRIWGEWLDVVLGTWLIVSPWLFGFGGSLLCGSIAIAAGIAVVGLAGWSILAAAETPQGIEDRFAKAGYEHWRRPLPDSPLWRL
jgi:hypothetical protein